MTCAQNKLTILPVYLNSNNWKQDFEDLYNWLLEFEDDNIMIIGDLNARIVPPARDGVEVHGAARVRILLFMGHHGQLHTIWLTTNAHDAARARHFLVTGHRGHWHISAGQAEPENTKTRSTLPRAIVGELYAPYKLPLRIGP
ncbi:hypothetical protein ACLKA7_000785 [Drosophila subpalustris]